MESIAAAPETALDLIRRTLRVMDGTLRLIGGILPRIESGIPSSGLSELATALVLESASIRDAARGLRGKQVTAGVLAAAREQGYREGYRDAWDDGRRALLAEQAAVTQPLPRLKAV